MCIFCDASLKALSAVAYLKVTDARGHIEVGFIKAKLAPEPEITVPRLELCAAILAVEIADLLQEELDMTLDDVKFFTDSKVVLGYIFNESRRFYVYVHNRVQRIRQSTKAGQWNYVPTNDNHDHATRSLPADQMVSSTWLTGPAFLTNKRQILSSGKVFSLVDPESDVEVRSEVTTCVTSRSHSKLESTCFGRFSAWSPLLKAVARLGHIAKSFIKGSKDNICHGFHKCNKHLNEEQLNQAKATIIRTVQGEMYAEDIRCLQEGRPVPKSSPLSKLCPFIDSDEILVGVGGRLARAQLTSDELHPILIPGRHHITQLLVRHFHVRVCHQGRHFTEGAIRAARFWIVGGKRAISSIIFNCVTCRKLRGKQEEQIMADLPADRLRTDPPFTYVGLDVFGP